MDYHKKYIKYKNKYFTLQNSINVIGGNNISNLNELIKLAKNYHDISNNTLLTVDIINKNKKLLSSNFWEELASNINAYKLLQKCLDKNTNIFYKNV